MHGSYGYLSPGRQPQLEHKPWSSHIVQGLTRRLAGSLIVSTLLVEDVRVGAGLYASFSRFLVKTYARALKNRRYAPQPGYGAVRSLLCSQ
jgi:hypothetical protein